MGQSEHGKASQRTGNSEERCDYGDDHNHEHMDNRCLYEPYDGTAFEDCHLCDGEGCLACGLLGTVEIIRILASEKTVMEEP